jgi:hypothetical protein
MRPRWQVTVAGVAGVVLVAGAMAAARPTTAPTPPADTSVAGASTSASPPPPAVVKDCWVPAPAGNISLTADEAKDLTTVAATATDPDRREQRVREVVARTLDVTPDQATTVARSLLGDRSTQRLTCSYVRLDVPPEDPGPSGLTPRARKLRAAWTEVFGPLVAGGFAAGGVDSGHVDSSSHYEGRALDVFFRPPGDDEQRRRGRVFAQWLVAHAQDFHVLSVIYADRIWTSWAAYAGWRDYVHPSGNRSNPILRHLDHVHVAVESGRPYRG